MLPRRSFPKLCLLLLGSILFLGVANAATPINIHFENGWRNWFYTADTNTTPENTFVGSLYSLRRGPEHNTTIHTEADVLKESPGNVATVNENMFFLLAYYCSSETGVVDKFAIRLTADDGKVYVYNISNPPTDTWLWLESNGEKRVKLTDFVLEEDGTTKLAVGREIHKIAFAQNTSSPQRQYFCVDSIVITDEIDTQKPNRIQKLVAVKENGELVLNWELPSDNRAVAGYYVYRGSAPDNLEYIATVTSRFYKDTDIEMGKTYYYAVSAFDFFDNVADQSNIIQINADDTPPPAPEGLVLTPHKAGNGVRIQWSGTNITIVPDFAGYKVYEKTNGEFAEKIFVPGTDPQQTQYSLNLYNLNNGQLYTYRISAVDTFGNESAFIEGSVTPFTEDPVILKDTFEDGLVNGWSNGKGVGTDGHLGSKYTFYGELINTSSNNIQLRKNITFGVNPETYLSFSYKVVSPEYDIQYMRAVCVAVDNQQYITDFANRPEKDRWHTVHLDITKFKTEAGQQIELGTEIKQIQLWARRYNSTSSHWFYIDDIVIMNGKDVTPPEPITDGRYIREGMDNIVSWSIPYDQGGVAGFNIYRGTSPSFTPNSGNKLNSALLTDGHSYRDADGWGKGYYYLVEAVDYSGNTSLSNPIGPDLEPPVAPEIARVEGRIPGQITLYWNDPVPAQDGDLPVKFNIYRSTTAGFIPGSDNLVAKDIDGSQRSWTNVTDLVAGQVYYYMLGAVDYAGNEGFSQPVAAKTIAGQSINMIKNPSVEYGSGELPDSWGFYANSGDPKLYWVSDYAAEGRRSLKLEGDSLDDRGSANFGNHSVSEHNLYKVSIWYRSEDVVSNYDGIALRIMIDAKDAPPDQHLVYDLNSLGKGTVPYWKHFEKLYAIPPGGAYLAAQFFIWQASGRIWIDNAALVKLPVPLSPAPDAVAGEKVHFAWERVAGATYYVLEYARNADFSDSVVLSGLSESELTLELVEGQWYWRVGVHGDFGYGQRTYYSDVRSFQISISGKISGRVVSNLLPDLSGIEVQLANGGAVYTTVTGADGAFQFEKLPPGTYTLSAGKEGFLSEQVLTFELAEGEEKTGLELRLVKEAVLAGSVSLARDSVAADVFVVLQSLNEERPYSSSLFTDASGAYRFSGLYPGSYLLKFTKQGYVSASFTVELAEGETKDFHVTLYQHASIDDWEETGEIGWEVSASGASSALLSRVSPGYNQSSGAMQVNYSLAAGEAIVLRKTDFAGADSSWKALDVITLFVSHAGPSVTLEVGVADQAGTSWSKAFQLSASSWQMLMAKINELTNPQGGALASLEQAREFYLKIASATGASGTLKIDRIRASAQLHSALITGQLSAGAEPQRAVVSLLDLDWNVLESISPASDGFFSASTRVGGYYLIAASSGFESSDPVLVWLEPGEEVAVNISLAQLPAQPDTIHTISDFEHLKDWEKLGKLSGEYVKSGKYSAVWTAMDKNQPVRINEVPSDWTDFTQLEFWAYLEKPSTKPNAGINITVDSENDQEAGWDYYDYKIMLNWQGWKHFVIPFSKFNPNRRPAGWDKINYLAFQSTGWSLDPDPDVVLYIDGLRLATGAIGGMVLLPDNSPAAGAAVKIEDEKGQVYNLTTDENGRFRYRGLASSTLETGDDRATYYVSSATEEFVSKRVAVEISSGADVQRQIQLLQPGQITGQLKLFQKEDNSGITVEAIDLDTGAVSVFVTEADGVFRFAKLVPGTYRVTARKSGYGQVTIADALPVEAGETVQIDPLTMLRSSYWTDLEDGTLQGWQVQAGHGQISVVELGAQESKYALQVVYNLPGAGAQLVLSDATGGAEIDWLDFNAFQIWILGDASGNSLTVQLTDPSGLWEYSVPIDFRGYRRFDIPIEAFVFKGSGNPGAQPQMNKLSACKLIVSRQANASAEGTILIDEFYPYRSIRLSGKAILARATDHSGITITATDGSAVFQTQTDKNGNYSLAVAAGTYQVTAAKAGASKQTRVVTVDGDQPEINFQLELSTAGGWLLVEDFENPQRVSQLGIVQDGEKVKSGSFSGKWANHPSKPTLVLSGGDWSKYSRLNFWVYSEVANGAGVQVVIRSENPASSGIDYYQTSFIIDWTGWKFFSIPFSQCGPSREPIGWHKIDSLDFVTNGWGWTPDPTSVLYFDSVILTDDSTQPGTIVGKAVLEGKTDHSGIRIEARSAVGLTFSATTDANGQFVIEGALPGKYELVASRDGFKTAAMELELKAGSAAQAGQLQLAILGRPNKPEDVVCDSSIPGEVRLSWRAPGMSKEGYLAVAYLIYRAEAGAPLPNEPHATVQDPNPAIPGNLVQWIDLGVDDKTYDYYLAAVDSNGNASELAGPFTVTAMDDKLPPLPPMSLAADVSVPDQVTLVWDAPEAEEYIDQAVAFRVYRATAPGGQMQLLAEVQAFTWTDRQLEKDKKYIYRVTALDHVGNESEPSEEVLVEPEVTTIDVQHRPVAIALKGQGIKVQATARTSKGTLTGKLYYKQAAQSSFAQVELRNVEGDLFEAEIPASAVAENIEYYLEFSNGTRQKKVPELEQYEIQVVELDKTAVDITNLTAIPNPFFPKAAGYRGQVEINFVLGVPALTTIRIYNTAGQLILEEDLGLLAEGKHAYRWDGRDSLGRFVAAGPYLCQVIAQKPQVPTVKRVVLLVVMR